MLDVYPIGRVSFPSDLDEDAVRVAIARIEALPGALGDVLAGCRDLDRPVREGIWSVRALAHHLADAHLVAYVRTRRALTEDAPEVAPYAVEAWAGLGDAAAPPEASLTLLTGLHARWATLLRSLGPDELRRPWRPPGVGEARPLWRLPLTYAWHGDHHVAQIRQAREHFGF